MANKIIPAMLPELDLFETPPTQTSVERIIFTEHRSTSTLQDTSFLEFYITSSKDEYIMLNESPLHLSLKISLASESKDIKVSKLDFTKNTVPANYLLHSIFKQVNLTINDKQISRDPQTYAYRSYIEALLGFSDEAKKTLLTSSLWYEKEDDRIKQFTVNEKENIVTAEVDLMGKLHTDMTFHGKALPGGSSVRLKLHLHDPSFYIKLKSTLTAKVEITNAMLSVKRMKVTQNLLNAHLKALNMTPYKYYITRSEVKQRTIVAGSNDCILDNVVLGQQPRRAFIMMVKNKAYNGSYTEDCFNFDHFNVSHIECFVDGRSFPASPYQPNFDENKYIRVYYGLLQALSQTENDSTITFDRTKFKNGNVIFGFNFADDCSNGAGLGGHLSPIKRGSMGVKIVFRKPLQEAVNLLLYCEFDNIIQIDKEDQVTTDYN